MDKPVIAIFGFKNSGKTKFIEYAIESLGDHGFKVGVVKHIHHGDFEVDIEGKDTWRYLRRGAVAVSGVSSKRLYINVCLNEYPDLVDVIKYLNRHVDIIFLEGFSHILSDDDNIPKIIVGKDYPIESLKGKIIHVIKDSNDYDEALKKLISLTSGENT